jgi:hypothetical protein
MRRLAVVFLLFLPVASAQEFRATLQGTIFDPNQAVVPGVELALTNVATSVERKTVSDNEGHYVFQFVPPGTYSVTAEVRGFRTERREGVQLSVSDNVRLDITLNLGQTSEKIVVAADAVAVAAESSSLGTVVRREIVDTLPIKGHGSLTMFTLAAGIENVSNGDKFSDDVRPIDQANNQRYSANGSPVGTGDTAVDGVPNMIDVNRGYYINGYVPPVDSVGEFKLQMGTLPAEYGKSSGSIMTVVIKSGTNSPHGTLYENLRNSKLDANLFFNNIAGQKLPTYQVNMFGVSLGGPVYLPKVYNGKNRTFFFVNYEGLRQNQAQSGRYNVPTAKMRTGDFSEVSAAIYNPYSIRIVNNVPTRDPFPNNVIPASLQDPVGRKLMDYYPKPNLTPAGAAWVNNYAEGTKFKGLYDITTMKFDHTISQKQQMFVRLNFGPGTVGNPYSFTGIASPGNYTNQRPNRGLAISDTYIFSPRIAADFRFGIARGDNTTTPFSSGFDVSALGFSQSFLNSGLQGKVFPSIGVSDMTGLGNGGFAGNPGTSFNTADAVTISTGKHLFKTGGEVRVIRGNYFANSAPTGTFSFGVSQTGGPNASTPTGGFGLASLLVGFGSGSIPTGTGVSTQNVYYAVYFQDDFRVTSRLTLNLGVRWEYETPRTERYNRSVRGFAYNTPSPLKVPGYDLRGGMLYAGVGGVPRGLFDGDWNNFSPRLGFAYSLNKETVVRGGYSLSYIPIVTNLITSGYTVSTPWVSSTDGYTLLNPLSNPIPGGQLPVVGNSQGMSTFLGQGISFAEPGDVYPQFHNWNINIQRALPSAGVITIGYVGSRGLRLKAPDFNLDQVPTASFALGSALTQTVPNPFYGILTTGSLTGTTVQRAQLLRPYPQFTGVTRSQPALGQNSYHSLQISYSKGMAHGLSGVVAYTASRNMSNLHSPQDIYDRRTERGPDAIDVPSRFSAALAWNIPVGRGRQFLNHIGRPADLIIGGWQISNASVFQGGTPVTFGVTGGTYVSNTIRPNVTGNPAEGITGSITSRLNRYFNTAAFSRPANFTLGNLAPRIGTVRAPGNNSINLTLSKSFTITESSRVEFRATQFNLPNHPIFGGPNTTVGNAAFGTISGQANAPRQTEFTLRVVF